MFNKHDITRNEYQLFGGQAKCGYDWWWHFFTGHHAVTGKKKPFFFEFFLCNPAHGGDEPKFGRLGDTLSYVIVMLKMWVVSTANIAYDCVRGIRNTMRHENVFL